MAELFLATAGKLAWMRVQAGLLAGIVCLFCMEGRQIKQPHVEAISRPIDGSFPNPREFEGTEHCMEQRKAWLPDIQQCG